nr:unnamed protein product [Spirometra erinaceieuropaei]
MAEHAAAVRRNDASSQVAAHSTRSGHTFKFDEADILARGDNRVSRELLESWFTGPQSINKCNDLPIPYSVLKLRLGGVTSHAGSTEVNTLPNTGVDASDGRAIITPTSNARDEIAAVIDANVGHQAIITPRRRSHPTAEATAAGSVANLHTHRPFRWDRIVGAKLFGESGAEVSVVPPTAAERKTRSTFCLTAANNSSIPTFARRSITLDVRLRRIVRLVFIIADNFVALIGADVLAHFNLLVYLRSRRLVDCITKLHARCQSDASPCVNPLTVMPVSDCPFCSLFGQLPGLTNPPFREVDIKHTVTNHISTTGPPKSCRPCRLAPERLKIAKA